MVRIFSGSVRLASVVASTAALSMGIGSVGTGAASVAQITGQPTQSPLNVPAQSVPSQPLPSQPLPSQAPVAPTTNVQPALQPQALSSVSAANYVLGSGDQISLSVVGYPEFTGTLAILPDGSMTLPLLGQVRAQGMTANQLSASLTQQLREYLVDPVVNVGLVVARPVVVTVSGEVHRPGPIQLSGLNNSDSVAFDPNSLEASSTSAQVLSSQSALPTLSSAVLLAGGVTTDADIRQVVVRRPVAGGREELLTLNLWDTITANAGSADIELRDGDSIFVPALTGDAIDRRVVASSSLAPSTVRVKVVGEVVRPGEVAVPPNSSISSAVAIAGGPTTDAQISSVSLVRQSETGEIQQSNVDLSNLVDDYQIEEGDVIVVRKRGYLSVVDGIGRVLNPLNVFRLLGF